MSALVYMEVKFAPHAKKRLQNLLEEAQEVLENQSGFRGMKKYRCLEEDTLFGLLEWDRLEDFEACKRTPDWLVIMPEWSDLLEEEAVELVFKYCETMA